MVASRETDKTQAPAPVVDKSHSSEAHAATEQTPAQSESMALMKANSQARATGESGAGSSADATSKKTEPVHLDFTLLKELAPNAPADSTTQAREALVESATKSFGGDAAKLAKFESNMQQFEDRTKSSAFAQPGDVAKTFGEVKKLLDTPSDIVSDQNRATLAENIIDRAAHPLESNQGNSNDCAAASIENLLYTKSPAIAAKYVSDLALSGKFTDQQGNVVSVDNETIATPRADLIASEIKMGVEPRNYADQVIQAAIRNEDLALKNKANGISSDGQHGLKYEVRDHDDFVNKSGEQIIDYSKNPPKDVTPDYYGGMMSEDIPKVAAALDVKNAKNSDNLYMDSFSVSNATEFKAALANPDPPYPRILGVNMAKPPFTKPEDDVGNGGHAITVSSYDPKTNLIHYRDPQHASVDATTDADTMYNGLTINRGDGPLTDGGRELRENRGLIKTDPKQYTDSLYSYLQETDAAQRSEVLKILAQKSGIDLNRLLSDYQKRELGLLPQ